MRTSFTVSIVSIGLLLLLASMSLFIVDQRQKGMIFRLGEITSIKTDPQ